MSKGSNRKPLIIIRGAGDIASGIIVKLLKVGFHVIALEIPKPSMVRRTVSFAEAIFAGEKTIEGITAKVAGSLEEGLEAMSLKTLPILIDPKADCVDRIKKMYGNRYVAFVDATISKRNIGTRIDMAPIVVGIGPGFEAGKDCHAVVESMRGHYLGRIIYDGSAIPNTGIPGEVGGQSLKRLLKAPQPGKVRNNTSIGSRVNIGDIVQYIELEDGTDLPVLAQIEGIVRGLIIDGFDAKKGLKIGDIDPRAETTHCFSISDKAFSIGGGVLQAILELHGGVDSFE